MLRQIEASTQRPTFESYNNKLVKLTSDQVNAHGIPLRWNPWSRDYEIQKQISYFERWQFDGPFDVP